MFVLTIYELDTYVVLYITFLRDEIYFSIGNKLHNW